jgi:hypothetical protein
VIPKKKSATESVTAEFARPTNGATTTSAPVAIVRVAALPCFPANWTECYQHTERHHQQRDSKNRIGEIEFAL